MRMRELRRKEVINVLDGGRLGFVGDVELHLPEGQTAALTVFEISVPFGSAMLAVFGLFTGIFVGCLAMALAETLKVIPVLVQRVKLATGLPFVILAMALGKAVACFYQLYFRMQH